MKQELIIRRGETELSASLELPRERGNRRFPLVILMHALMMDRREPLFEQITQRLLERDMAVLRFDFSGHGRSGGRFEDMTLPLELEDAAAVLAYGEQLSFVGSVSLLGHSQGGVVAGMTAGAFPEKIHALVLMAPAATLAEEARRGRIAGARYDPAHIPPYISCFGRRVKGDYAKTAQTLPIYEQTQHYPGPVCLIHGTADALVPATASQQYHTCCKNSRLHLIPGADHEFYRRGEQAVSLAVDFLSEQNRQDIKMEIGGASI